MTGMSSPLCWQGYDKDLGGYKKLMWYGIVNRAQLQGLLHMVFVRKRKRKCLHAHAFEPEKKRQKQWTGWKLETDG